MKRKRAVLFGDIAYRNYIDSMRNDFKQRYYNTCMSAEDTLDVRYELKEYHYTLYYYDQAGNLIQTVPPQGVHVIQGQDSLQQISEARNGLGSMLFPNHSLQTSYRYNTLNEVRWQNTPDGGISEFWYDRLGRMAVSQNAEQADQSIPNYSYTLYDSLGRITEVGQLQASVAMSKQIAFDTSQLNPWIAGNTKSQITRTWYDTEQFSLTGSGFDQMNLRSRVVSMAYFEHEDSTYQHAVHYSYDIHGNVYSLLRENVRLHEINHGFKTVDYDYDLVSGNVNRVSYQADQDDQFYHRYYYDYDNRLIGVETSSDNVHWDQDATYYYYMHGPLKRMTLGALNVQGLDYAYTIHGWLKGVNGNSLTASRDIGRDGYTGSVNSQVARDVFGFSLHYYDNDYKSINGWKTSQSSNYFLMAENSSSGFNNQVSQLYNGNISRMVTALSMLNNEIIGKAYEYDQLNRISKAFTFNNYSQSTNTWNAGSATQDFYSAYTYDANGNILSLIRNAENGTGMDSLTYHYQAGTNKLLYVDDDVAASSFTYDIDDQSSGNYTYDKIGNLISDTAEEIGEITWTVYGKIKSITRTSGSKKPNLSFEYTPDGHRVAKHVTDSNDRTTSTWYVRDASGNILSTYTRSWVQAASNASITFVDIYNQLKLDKTYSSRVDFLNQNIQWHTSIPSATIDTLETDVLTGHLLDVLENFSIIPFLSPTEIQSLYNTISAYDVIQMLQHSGYQDEYIYDILCPAEFVNLLTAQISQDFFNFLDQLQLLDPTIYDQMCIDLGVPPGTPAATIVSIFTVNDVVAALVTGGGSSNCSVFKSVYDQTIGFNHSTSWAVLSSVSGFNAAIYSHFTLSNLALIMESYFGYREMWQKYFNVYVGTESTMLHAVRTAHLQSFIYHSFLEINDEAFLSSTVGQLTGQTTETWLSEVESYYGTTYLQQLCEAIGYSIDPVWQFALQENHIYGSSRVGLVNRNLALAEQVANSDSFYNYSYSSDSIITFYRSQKRYELSNHLGNVLAVITDRRIQSCAGGEVMYYEAQVVSVSDYYPFGSMIENRSWSAGSGYRFGFNGKEKDLEGTGSGGSTYDYGFRIYNPRVGKFLSVDPLTQSYPWYTPYQFAGNKPIVAIDLDGLEESIATMQMTWDDKAVLSGKMSWREHQARAQARLGGAAVGAGLVLDVFLTKGAVTKNILKQFAQQLVINSAVNSLSGDWDPGETLSESIHGIDLADAIFSLNKSAKPADKFLELVLSSSIDVTVDGISNPVDGSKKASDVAYDLLANQVSEQLGGAKTKWSPALKELFEITAPTLKKEIDNFLDGNVVTVTAEALRFRTSASIENTENVHSLLSSGTRLLTTGRIEGAMVQVLNSDGDRGWVSSEYIESTNDE